MRQIALALLVSTVVVAVLLAQIMAGCGVAGHGGRTTLAFVTRAMSITTHDGNRNYSSKSRSEQEADHDC